MDLREHGSSSIAVRAYGRDSQGSPFSAVAAASQISRGGALLADIRVPLRCGHPVMLEYQSQQAQFRVVWARDGRIAVQRCEGESCPWAHELPPARPSA
jgi:hypothetical protein